MEGKDRIYTLEGKAGDREYAIMVASNGVILEVYNKDYYEKNTEDHPRARQLKAGQPLRTYV